MATMRSGRAVTMKQRARAKKATKQANGANPSGGNKRTPPAGTNGKTPTRVKRGSASDRVPGKTTKSYKG